MTHLLKYLAVPMAFMAAVVLFASPSAPGALGSVGGVAYADGGMCYGGSDTNGSGENSDYGDNGCEPPTRCEHAAAADPMMLAGSTNFVASGFGGGNVAGCIDDIDFEHLCYILVAIVATVTRNGTIPAWIAAACGIAL